jgi:hypothetical protein
MKKLLLAIVASVGLALPALAAAPPYYAAGGWDGWATHTLMTETFSGSGIWQLPISTTAGRYEFKITQGDWGWSYPGANSWLYTDGSGNVSITYDANTYADGWSPTSQRIGLNVDPGSWTAAGDFQGWNNAEGNMTPLGGGIYTYQVTTPGSHSWKAVVTGSWDSISWDNRSVGTANWDFTVGAGEAANLYVNALAGTAKMEIVIVPEPSTLALLGCGLAAGFCCLRRRH